VFYQPTFDSVKTHPLPDWYNDAKLGIFIHWGLYSVPAFAPCGENYAEKLLSGELGFSNSPYAEWYQNSLRISGSPTHNYHIKTYGADFAYEQFSTPFNQALADWNPDATADLFARAGAKYVVLVSKHHDGFLMWNSRHTNPRRAGYQASRDVAGELTRAVSERGMKMGFYYSSLLDWTFTPRPITTLPELLAMSDTSKRYRAYVMSHWRELIERYDPWILWSDIGYPPGEHLPALFADFYNRKPDGVVNDRWLQIPAFLFNPLGRAYLGRLLKKIDTSGSPPVPHCDFITAEYSAFDGIQTKKWEACRGIGNSFGYNQFEGETDYLTAADAIRLLADAVSKNGNLLLNVGPKPDGSLHPAQVSVLEGLGSWLSVNGQAIYGTRPWIQHKDAASGEAEIRYTAKNKAVYAIITRLPANRKVYLLLDAQKRFTLLETGHSLQAVVRDDRIEIDLPAALSPQAVPVIKIV
jgi:alpha-L-fucosidase